MEKTHITILSIIKEYLNRRELHVVFVREDVITYINDNPHGLDCQYGTLKEYFALLQRAGHIKRVGFRQYELLSHIPLGATLRGLKVDKLTK